MPRYTASISIEIESEDATQARYDIEDIAALIEDEHDNVERAEMTYWQVDNWRDDKWRDVEETPEST